MVEILQIGNPVLETKAEPITKDEFGSPELKKLITKMSSQLKTQDDGIAIAAPQIGISKRVFVVSGKAFQKFEDDPVPPDRAFINPKLTKLSKEKTLLEEGCLSVRGLLGKVRRSKKATVEAYDIDGKKFSLGGSGLLAQIFQHEYDHLEGILFIERAETVYKDEDYAK